jgi:hypothetical protein
LSPELWLGVLAFLLLAAPKTRLVVAGAPLYAVDVLIALIVVGCWSRPKTGLRSLQPLPAIISLYAGFIVLSEAKAAIAYGSVFYSFYMATRFVLAIALAFVLPKMLTSYRAVGILLKGLTLGALFAATLTIMYSLPATRPLVVSTVFSFAPICPESAMLVNRTGFYAVDAGIRGRSLLGASTFTSGVLGGVWPLMLLARSWLAPARVWRRLASVACVLVPVAILMTYGRTAWLTVIVVSAVLLAFRQTGGRRTVIVLVAGVALVLQLLGWRSDLFMIDRVVTTTRQALEAPTVGRAERERFLSYVEPFSHLVENPSWVVAGTGRSSERLARRGSLGADLLVDERGRATHSAFGITYYCFGFMAALCQIGFVVFGLLYLFRHASQTSVPMAVLLWQVLFASWSGMSVWWLFGHGIAGEPRGAMVFFLVFGLVFSARAVQQGLEYRVAWRSESSMELEAGNLVPVAMVGRRISST